MTDSAPAWQAHLDLRFRRQDHGTTLASRHRGPLRVQKALYPEGPQTCHAIVLHPPGGIAGGDALELSVEVEAGAHALLTTPGAAKWYKADGRIASQQIRLVVDGALEWLPQESIVFDAAEVRSDLRIALGDRGAILGWDIVALGRKAAGEAFTRGAFRQAIELRHDDELQWLERTAIRGADPLLDSPVGLNGRHVFGSVWAGGPDWTDDKVDAIRAACGEELVATRLSPRLLVARAAGHSTGAVRRSFQRFWSIVRPLVFAGRAAQAPRIWAT
jgi:urease accessory protein